MNAAQKRYAVEDLTIGMFVTQLDCPITSTPFPLQGFYIKSKDQLADLATYCSYVVVNVSKSKAVQSLNSTLNLEVMDVPKALTNPVAFKAEQLNRRLKRPQKPRRKGRVMRLVVLLVVSAAIYSFYDLITLAFTPL
ncbi:MAG: DUF3391 domain-containing protein [Agarilytica sp.]